MEERCRKEEEEREKTELTKIEEERRVESAEESHGALVEGEPCEERGHEAARADIDEEDEDNGVDEEDEGDEEDMESVGEMEVGEEDE